MTVIEFDKKVKGFLGNQKKLIVWIIILIGILIILSTGLYTVNPEEVGVIQRFGKYIQTTDPGLRFKIPFGIDKLTKVRVRYVFKEEFGFRTLEVGARTRYSQQDFSDESLMLTGDLNIADVEWIIQYQIKDPIKYLFNVRDVTGTLRNLTESSMRQVVGDHSVDEVIVLSRQEVAYQTRMILQQHLDDYETGLEIRTVNLQNVTPPLPVQPAFNEVNAALQEEERIVNEARQRYNQVIPEARGKARQVIEQAEGYAVNRVNRATGDANRFIDVWREYNRAQTVTQKRLYLETMEEILQKANKIYIVDEDQSGLLPLLNLERGGN
ncbi:MAG: FtsH protease activity modulator HflK [Candidatus Cloacimonetes bacterium]|nr:FtsH protease activity modulator HflK [Candidatus Cloacimonadota bacterium]